MTFDQNSTPQDLRPINVAGLVAEEEPRIVPASSACSTGRNVEGFYAGSPTSLPVYYHLPVSDSAYVRFGGYGNSAAAPIWSPRMPVAVGHAAGVNSGGGFCYGPSFNNRVGVNAVDHQVSCSDVVAGMGYSPNLVVGVCSDQGSPDSAAARFAFGAGLADHGSGNEMEQGSFDARDGFSSNPSLENRSSSSAADHASEDGGEDSVSGKKVKFLCSFGGKILPRPSDNALRYVGGQTRIISVRRDVNYSELLQKMINAYGLPVSIKYKLPDEDLDALVSVSCQDDVDNMMDEYEKLVERSGDCSVKLRVFLFLASELDPSGVVQFRNMHDSGQKYVDAVNGVGDAVGGSGITRKESIASAASTQNSDLSGSEAIDNSGFSQGDIWGPPLINKVITEGNSSSSSQDASPQLMCVDPTASIYEDSSAIHLTSAAPIYGETTLSSQPEVKIESTVPPSTPQKPAEIPPPASYVQAFADPRPEAIKKTYLTPPPQMGSANFQMWRPVGSTFTQPRFHERTARTASHHFGPAVHMTMAASSTYVGVTPAMVQPPIQPQQTLLERHPTDSAFGPRVVQLPVDQSYAGYHSQVPRAFVGGGYYLNQLPASNRVVFSDGSVPSQQVIFPDSIPRLEDCYMCHKQLPHQHSDALVQNKRDVLASPVSDTSSCCHSFQLEEHIRAQPLNRVMVSGSLGIATIEQGIGVQPKVISHMNHHITLPHSEAAAIPHKFEAQWENEGIVLSKAENCDQPGKTFLQGTSRLECDIHPPYGIGIGAIPHSLLETKAQQHPFTTRPLQENEICVPEKLGNCEPVGDVVNHGVTGITSGMWSPYREYLGGYPESFQETFVPGHLMQNQHQVGQDSRMNRPRASDALSSANIAAQASDWNESNRDSGSARDVDCAGNNTVDGLREDNGRMENLNICPPESLLNSDQARASADEHRVGDVFNGNPQQNFGREIILENDINLSNVVHETSQSKPTEMPTFTSPEVSSVHNVCPGVSYEMDQISDLGISLSFSQTVPGGRPQESTDRYFNPPLSVIEPASVMNKVPPTTEQKEDVSHILPHMVLNDVDFMASSGGTAPPVSPSSQINALQNPSNSIFSNQDPWNLQFDTPFPPKPNKIATKKEFVGARDPLVDISTGEARLDDGVSQQSSNMSSAEDNIKQQLQAVAEGVAASVFQPATVSNADSSLSNVNEHSNVPSEDQAASYTDADMQLKAAVEDSSSIKSEKANVGFPISDGIGRLQIIKNSDLEELRELGSGTFGTVYHGKWRGTDVAIKRINARCFAGKASDQEHMRDDFWNEAIKLAELHHPNVLAFYGVVLDGPGGSVATVTEYMINGSLRNVLQKSERGLDKRKRLLIAMDVAFGMEYLHGKNIVHFDLKSDNLLVNLRDLQRPICKVGDLGLSKVKCQTLISGGVRGTLPWMAPELLDGSSSLVSDKVDVFSFGIVMWELLTGEEPYADLHYGAIIGGIVSNTLRPQVPESCDLEWRALMERCWSAEPSERPGFTEIVNEFRSMAAKLPPKVQNTGQHAATAQPQVQK